MEQLTLGSLFDGSGGFPLGGILAGIKPIWASEIEPFPIRVTTKRMPFMKHYGDITAMDGAKIEPVDIITFGSPCQDMSVAGKRAGIDGSRSSLFYEAIRIIKEMRVATNGEYPRYIVWENVNGAFSSNKGEDFRCVLESICKVKDESVSIPRPRKWLTAGCIMGNEGGYSVAWRQFDAQYWGVPQRRKRIYLVADFAGGRAGDILFESEGLSGYTPQGFRTWEETAGYPVESTGEAGCICLNDQPPVVLDDAFPIENHPTDSRVKLSEDGKVQTLTSRMGTGGNNVPLLLKIRCGCDGGGKGPLIQRNKSATLSCNNVATDYKDPPLVNDMEADKAEYIVRRLTPTECARLQGFPDWWCTGLETEEPTKEEITWWREVFETHRRIMGTSQKAKTEKQIIKWLQDPHSDSAEYKMWGNGVALPCVYFVLSGIVWAALK